MDVYGGHSSKIGQYIHFNRQYYLSSALNTRRGRRDDHWNPEQQLNEMHNSIISQVSQYGDWVHANKLAEKLNYYYGFKNKTIKAEDLDKAERDLLEEAITDYLSDYEKQGLELDMQNLKFDYLSSQTSLGKGVSKFRVGKKKGEQYSKTYLNTLCNKIEMFLKIAKPKKATLGPTQVKEIENLESQWKALKAEFQAKYRGQDISTLKKEVQLITKTGERTAAGNMIDEFDRMLEQYRLGQAVQNGLLGEFVIPAILFMVENKGNNELRTIMKDFAKGFSAGRKGSSGSTANGQLSYQSVGGMGSKKALLKSNIKIHMDNDFINQLGSDNKFLHYTEEDGNGNIVACSATQDKVDTVITQPDHTYKLSVKNYQTQLHSDIQLHSGNLLRLIQQETDFINHFLNITSYRTADGRSVITEKRGDFTKETAELAQNTMKELILARSLVGGVITNQGATDMANYFALNDSSNGYFYVIPMSAMINTGISDSGVFKVFYNGSSTTGNLLIYNRWQVKDKNSTKTNSYIKAYARIRKMVIEFAKVSVSTKMSARQIKNLRGR